MKIPENLKNNRCVIDLERSELIARNGRLYVAGPTVNPPIINIPPRIAVGEHDGEEWAVQEWGPDVEYYPLT